MKEENTFLGAMIWFTGVIESVDDPEELGRVKVRCFGYHTPSNIDLPTEDLPFASCAAPITSASMSGIGESTTGLLPGSWVIGFFKDGKSAQDPVVIGSIPSVSFQRSIGAYENAGGFVDPDSNHPREDGVPDIPKMARSNFKESQFFVRKKELRQESIETAAAPDMSMVEGEANLDRSVWSNNDPEIDIAPVYPKNNVKEYQSGHIVEYDDTKEKERISEMHSSGTYHEINAAGDRTHTVVGDDYEVIFGGKNVYIKGSCNLTIDGDLKTLVKGNYNLEVEKDYTVNVKGSHHEKIGSNHFSDIAQEKYTNVGEDRTLRVGKNEFRDIEIDSDTIVKQNVTEIIGGNRDCTTKGRTKFISKQQFIGTSTNSTLTLTSRGNMKLATSAAMTHRATGTITCTGQAIFLN